MKILLSNSIQEYMRGLSLFADHIYVFNTLYRKKFTDSDKVSIVPDEVNGNVQRCAKYVEEKNIDILYAQGMRSLLFFEKVKRCCHNKRPRLFVTCHSPALWDSIIKSFIYVAVASSFCDGIVFLVERTRVKWLWLTMLLRCKTYHVPNPADLSRFAVIRKFPIDYRPVNVGCIGVIAQRKNQERLIDIAAILKQKGENFIFHIAGNVKEESYATYLRKKCIERNVKDQVIFDGTIPYDAVPDWLNRMDIYCCPSRAEVMPFSILEAMACGLPVVAHNIAGIHEEVHDGENGYLVDSDDPNDYVKALIKITDNHSAEAMGKKSRSIAEKIFALPLYAEKMYRIFSE